MRKRIIYLLLAPLLAGCSVSGDWSTASRESAGIAPDPSEFQDAIIQVYGADAWGWRGWFAIHTWIAVKRAGEQQYTVLDVVGWRSYWNSRVVRASYDIPDRHWYGARPDLLLEIRGDQAEVLIDRIESAVAEYPWKNEYKAFPGPNSNTFVAWVGHRVPELELDLPFSAIGSGYVTQYKPEPTLTIID
ncbi:MAG: DUF3750 domain-containing protein [Gammaproteobacteria bacterium]|nr:DUF3750 domain-containing protein [Gammaproteobacteria bacterium]